MVERYRRHQGGSGIAPADGIRIRAMRQQQLRGGFVSIGRSQDKRCIAIHIGGVAVCAPIQQSRHEACILRWVGTKRPDNAFASAVSMASDDRRGRCVRASESREVAQILSPGVCARIVFDVGVRSGAEGGKRGRRIAVFDRGDQGAACASRVS